MALFHHKPDYYTEAMEIEHTPSKGSNYIENKRKSILSTYQDPLFPKLTLILFVSMLVLTLAMSAVELRNFFFYNTERGISYLLSHLSLTGLSVWGFYSAVLILICILAIRKTAKDFYHRQKLSGISDETEADKARSKRAIRRLNRTYHLYIRVSLIGLLIWLLIFGISFL